MYSGEGRWVIRSADIASCELDDDSGDLKKEQNLWWHYHLLPF